MKELLEYLLKELVSNPKEIKIEESNESDGTVHLSFSVAPDDMGIIIGKSGRMISAIRTLIKATAAREGKRVFLELEENSEQ